MPSRLSFFLSLVLSFLANDNNDYVRGVLLLASQVIQVDDKHDDGQKSSFGRSRSSPSKSELEFVILVPPFGLNFFLVYSKRIGKCEWPLEFD